MCVKILFVTLLAVSVHSLPIFNLQASQFGTNSFIQRSNRNLNRDSQRWYASYYNGVNNDSGKLAEIYGMSPMNQRNYNSNEQEVFRPDRDVVLNSFTQTPQSIEPQKVYAEQSSNSDFANIKRTISRKPIGENSHLDYSTKSKNSQSLYQNGLVFDAAMPSKKDSTEYTFNLQENPSSVQNTNNTSENTLKSELATSEMNINNPKVGEIPSEHFNGQTSKDYNEKPVSNGNTHNGEANGPDASGNHGINIGPGGTNADGDINSNAWGIDNETTTIIPEIHNRVSFDGGSCPTGYIRLAGKCVEIDR